MNYPIWDQPASGLLIAAISILHVFLSHFAVGGGLFLVLAERKARREEDASLLDFVRRLSRFFILATLVLGAVTGVGIWFTIGLVHPSATSSLINTFVWGWAIEWTFFVAEIAAALVYYHGWDRLPPRTHLAVGWIYFANAWLSMVVINGILSFMLTPGDWLTTREFWDGFLNQTCVPSLLARTCAAMAIAGLYALLVAARLGDAVLKAKVARWAGSGWILPGAAGMAAGVTWTLAAAAGAGVPVGEILGAKGKGAGAILAAVLSPPAATGHPTAQRAALIALIGTAVAILLTAYVVTLRRDRYGLPLASLLLAAGFMAMGGAEWAREDLRKPWVIGGYMFVNGVRLPAPPGAPQPPPEAARLAEDPFSLEALGERGVLRSAAWSRASLPAGAGLAGSLAAGRELFKLQCSACHTIGGWNAVGPLVAGKSPAAIEGVLGRLARPVDAAGRPAAWTAPDLRLASWRGRRMPPVAGAREEVRALSLWLASIGGAPAEALERAAAADEGEAVFERQCAACHASGSEWPIGPRLEGRDAASFYEMLGDLPRFNDAMPPFEGTEEDRRALAAYLDGLHDAEAAAAAEEDVP